MQNAPQTLNLPVYVQDNAYGMKNGSSFTLDPGTSEIGRIDCIVLLVSAKSCLFETVCAFAQ